MAFTDIYEKLGYVPKGAQPMTLDRETGDLSYQQTDPLSRLVRGLQKYQQEHQLQIEKQQKETQNKSDMYKTLRESGYDSKTAFEAVKKSSMPTEPGGLTKQEKTTALEEKEKGVSIARKELEQKILEKVTAGEDLTPGEQKVYDEVLRRREESDGLDTVLKDKKTAAQTKKIEAQTKNIGRKSLEEQIKEKVAKGKTLTPGEQKIWDEVIVRGKGGSDQGLEDVLANRKGMVPVVAPDGTPGWIPVKKLAGALKAGYTTRKK